MFKYESTNKEIASEQIGKFSRIRIRVFSNLYSNWFLSMFGYISDVVVVIIFQFWTDFAHCFDVSTAELEQVTVGWGIYLKSFVLCKY